MYLEWGALSQHRKTFDWRGVRAKGAVLLEMLVKSKYQSKWYGNRLALTIYVNAHELHSLPHDRQPRAPCLHKWQASFHPRG